MNFGQRLMRGISQAALLGSKYAQEALDRKQQVDLQDRIAENNRNNILLRDLLKREDPLYQARLGDIGFKQDIARQGGIGNIAKNNNIDYTVSQEQQDPAVQYALGARNKYESLKDVDQTPGGRLANAYLASGLTGQTNPSSFVNTLVQRGRSGLVEADAASRLPALQEAYPTQRKGELLAGQKKSSVLEWANKQRDSFVKQLENPNMPISDAKALAYRLVLSDLITNEEADRLLNAKYEQQRKRELELQGKALMNESRNQKNELFR